MIGSSQSAPRPGSAEGAHGFVLAGGRSSRMGQDKALVQLAGMPLVLHALAGFRQAGLPASIAGGQQVLSVFAPLVEDRRSGLGPLSGICAALASTSARWAVFIPIDLPLMPASLSSCLLQRAKTTGAQTTVSSVNGFAQTFPAVIERSALTVLERELQAGRGGCFAAFQATSADAHQTVDVVSVESLVQCGQASHPYALPASRWFLNINTPQNLRRAQNLNPAYRVG